MDVFGREWKGWTQKIEKNWKEQVKNEDLVLIAGDISWAMHIENAVPDLEWIDSLPGTKVLIRGNHDFWWSSKSKVEKVLPPSLRIICNNAFHWNDLSVGGARLWDTPEYAFFNKPLEKSPQANMTEQERAQYNEKIFVRELHRLELSLKELRPDSRFRLTMTHYPPIGPDMKDSRASKLLEQYNIGICVFGHLHGFPVGSFHFGEKNGVMYHLTACDYIDFYPLKIL